MINDDLYIQGGDFVLNVTSFLDEMREAISAYQDQS